VTDLPPSAKVSRPAELPTVLGELGLLLDVPVLSVVGGADGMGQADQDVLSSLLDEVVVPLLERSGAAVVYGGTDTGVMRAIGRARAAAHAGFPLVGVAAEGTINKDTVRLEPNHSHFVIVPGDDWGDESPWLFTLAAAIAGPRPSPTLVVNGGEITLGDIEQSLTRRIPVLVLAGTGRAANRIADGSGDSRTRRIANSPLTHVVYVHDRDAVRNCLQSLLWPEA
jgi:hypothetical protein